MTIFDWINQITLKKGKWDSFSETDQKKFQTYIINRFLSMNMYWIDIVNQLQKYTMGLPLRTKDVYNLYCDLIPKKKRNLANKSNLNKSEMELLSGYLTKLKNIDIKSSV